jgi:hypothetical protein
LHSHALAAQVFFALTPLIENSGICSREKKDLETKLKFRSVAPSARLTTRVLNTDAVTHFGGNLRPFNFEYVQLRAFDLPN